MKTTLEELLRAASRGEPVSIIHHHPCPDGFASAWCAWTRLGDKASYVPYDHEDPPDPEACRGAWVAMCDCCFRREGMERAAAMAKGMVVLDHHASSAKDCEGIPECSFDMGKSGCGMAWGFFRPGEEPPMLIACVQDRDLESRALAETAAFCAKLDSLPMDFESWDAAAKLSGPALERHLREGAEMLAQFEAQAQAIAAEARPCEFFGKRAYVANAPYRFASRCGAILCARPGCEMALTWSSKDMRSARLSMRSDGASCDVSLIASLLGGGGHPFASGASCPIGQLAELALPSRWPEHWPEAPARA